MGRITKETKTGSEDISYTYDSNNNRKKLTVGNKVTSYQYNKNDELLRTDTLNTDTEKDTVVIYKNDKNGNQLATINRYEIPSEQKDQTYIDIDVTLGDNRLNENVVNHYNALNQLTKTLTKNYKVSFTYDAEGLRTSKTVNGEKTVFVWDGDQLVMELSESGKVQKRYIRGNDLVYADKGENTEKQYYVTDPHGNVVQLTNESGKVTKTYEYDSFGNEVNPDKQDDNPFRYCGEYYDKETEEIYLRARYYQPAVGRFLTRDTYTGEEDQPLSLHLYTYCENDGVNAWDPSGHKKKAIILVGADYASNNNVFSDDATTWKNNHQNYKVRIYRGWENESLNELWTKINKKYEKKSISRLIIMAHSDFDDIYLSNNEYVSDPVNIIGHYSEDRLGKIKSRLKKNAKIYIHGCNAGGMAGYKNTVINKYAKKNKNGVLSYYETVAQKIANETRKKTYAYVNFTSQFQSNGGYKQKPTDHYGETKMTFDYYNKNGKRTIRKGRRIDTFTKFTPK